MAQSVDLTNTYAVLFNGPPSSGKDTAANALMRHLCMRPYNVYWERFSMPLKRSVCSWLGIYCDEDGNSVLDNDKNAIIPELGVSYRQAQIELSELHMKRYGKDVFGKLLTRRLANSIERDGDRQSVRVIIIPDSGFYDEISPLVSFLPPGNILIAQLRRDGTSFEGDSRSYVEHPGVTTVVIDNNLLSDFSEKIIRTSMNWITQR